MADRAAVAKKRALAEVRLRNAATSASEVFGVQLKPPALPAKRYPDLAAAQLVESVAEFIEQITQNGKRAVR